VLRVLHVQWQVLALADGTRDLDGLVLAARARGIEIEPDDLREFLGTLAEEGVLDEGVVEPADDEGDPDLDLAEVPLDPIEGWRFECSGRGVCCHVFPSILFTPFEAARALVVLPDEPHEFYPVSGPPREGANVAPLLVEGRCRYLDAGGRCELHARGGMDKKPAGCRAFPQQLVFDGERVRVSAAFECACVFDGIGSEHGDPPLDDGVRVVGDLPRPTRVGRVPDRVAIDDTTEAGRDEVRAFFRAFADASAPSDVAVGLWSLADAVQARGVDEAAVSAYSSPSAPSSGEASGMLASFASRLREWREPLATFRSPNDLTRRAFDWMIAASERAGAALPGAPAEGSVAARHEAFCVRASAWVLRDALGPLPLVSAIRVRALRIWLARALPTVVIPADPRADEPLALVEVMFRAHGLGAFAEPSSR
jgi:lysine-N-methylase